MAWEKQHERCRHALQSCPPNTTAVSQETEAWIHQKWCGLPDPCRIKPGFPCEDRWTQSRFTLGTHRGLLAAQCHRPAVVWQNRGDICCYNTKRGLKISCPMHFFPSHGERILLSCPFSNFPLFFPVFSLSLSLDVPSDSSLQWDVLSGSPTFALFSWNPQYMAGRASYVGKPGELGLGEMVLSFTDQKSPRKWRWAQNIHWFRYVLSPCFSRPMYLFIIYIIYTPMLESRVLWLL